MSRGLGHVERTILDALQATRRPYAELWELVALVDGQVASLEENFRHWQAPICEPHPKLRHPLPGVGMVDHVPACYGPEPARSVQESVARAVRSLARKGLVGRDYHGYEAKGLVVYLPTADKRHLPRARRLLRDIERNMAFGGRMPRRRWL